MIPEMTSIRVPGLGSNDADRVRLAVESLPGIFSVDVDADEHLVHVTYDTSVLPLHAIHGTIESCGHETEKEMP
jgi:copper chaperone CopZ